MDLRDYIRLLRRRWRVIALFTVLGVLAAVVSSMTTKPVYESSATLFVRAADSDGSIGSAYTGSLFTEQRVKSYREFVTSPTVTTEVAKRLDRPGVTSSTVASALSADSNLDTVNLNIHGRSGNPRLAQEITQTAAEVFQAFIGRLETEQGGTSPVALDIVLPAGPGSKVAPRPRLDLAIGLLVGLALGIGLSVLRETLDTRVKSPSDIDAHFGLSTLSVVGFDPVARSQPLIPENDPRSPRGEAYRRLRTNLQFVDVDQQPRSVVIASPLPNEGKTTTACNLAIAIAGAGANVVLVDGDLRKPSVGRYLGLDDTIGLTNVLIGEVGLDDALQSWGVSGCLRVLPAGTLPPNPSELLGSQAMSDLLDSLEQDHFVVIDAPPLLPVADGSVLATQASGVIVVIRLGKTRREQLSNALEAIDNVGGQVFGTVLNMATTRGREASDYGYGYYGSYAHSGAQVVNTRSIAASAKRAPADVPSDAVTAAVTERLPA